MYLNEDVLFVFLDSTMVYMANYARQMAVFPAIPGEAGIYLTNSSFRQKFGDLTA